MNEALDVPHITEDLPEPAFQPPHKVRFPVVWIVPVLAALACIVLVVRSRLEHGPTIQISFETAEGIEAGKTEVRYKNVIVGRVSAVGLTQDRAHVVVTVDVTRNASTLAVDDTQFWVERPRVGMGGVSGIGTLLSGAYIGVDIGESKAKRLEFVGLEKPPAYLRDQRGRLFVLKSPDPGSLSTGSPVYYRRIQVGAVSSAELTRDGKSADVRVFVRAPYDRFVTNHSRFWNSSGVDLTVGAEGLKLNTESLATVVAGGVTFQEFDDDGPGNPVGDDASFTLYEDRVAAFSPPNTSPTTAHMTFQGDTRGLALKTPVELHGVVLGEVTSVSLKLDPATRDFRTDVVATLYLERMGPAYATMREMSAAKSQSISDTFQALVDERGLHAQPRTGNLLLGQVYIALDFFKPSGRGAEPRGQGHVAIPTEPSTVDELQKQVRQIVAKISAIPFDEIGTNLRDTLKSASSVMAQVDKDIAPEARKIFQDARQAIQSLKDNVAAPDSEMQSNARATLSQMQRAAYSLRVLSEYLEQHPEALLRGRSNAPEPTKAEGSAH